MRRHKGQKGHSRQQGWSRRTGVRKGQALLRECGEMLPVEVFRVHRNGSVRKKFKVFIIWNKEPNFGKATRNGKSYLNTKEM